jgi:hypothetical protein
MLVGGNESSLFQPRDSALDDEPMLSNDPHGLRARATFGLQAGLVRATKAAASGATSEPASAGFVMRSPAIVSLGRAGCALLDGPTRC